MFVKNNFYKTEWRYFYIFASYLTALSLSTFLLL